MNKTLSNLLGLTLASVALAPSAQAAPLYQFKEMAADQTPGPDMVLVQEGRFLMGDKHGIGEANEGPVHEVVVEKPFAAAKYEVTVAQFRRFVEDTGYLTDAEKANSCSTIDKHGNWKLVKGVNWRQPGFAQQDEHPVVCVSWRDAVAYSQWLSEKTGESYRLPTEAEWEYVARAGTESKWFWGGEHQECKNANCCTGTLWVSKKTQNVGSYPANAFGVHDTAGNVWEWTASDYSERYDGSELKASDSAGDLNPKAVRGGSWYRFEGFTRSAARGQNWAQARYSDVGFRIVRDVSPEFVKQAEESIKTRLSMVAE